MLKVTPSLPSLTAVIAGTLVGVTGCNDSETNVTNTFSSLDDCNAKTHNLEQCELTYQLALANAESRYQNTHYQTKRQCETEYGENHCRYDGNNYLPMLAAYSLLSISHGRVSPYTYASSRTIDPKRDTYYQTHGNNQYSSSSHASSNTHYSNTKKSTYSRTKSRGGFGSTSRARSSWGSSSHSSWGG